MLAPFAAGASQRRPDMCPGLLFCGSTTNNNSNSTESLAVDVDLLVRLTISVYHYCHHDHPHHHWHFFTIANTRLAQDKFALHCVIDACENRLALDMRYFLGIFDVKRVEAASICNQCCRSKRKEKQIATVSLCARIAVVTSQRFIFILFLFFCLALAIKNHPKNEFFIQKCWRCDL